MSLVAETIDGNLPPERNWRDDSIDRLTQEGFYQHVAVPQPPERPHRREIRRTSPTYDYTTSFFPYTGKAKEEVDNYKALQRNLISRYGFDNVRTAFPTDEMIAEHPELGERPHLLFMVRPPENIPQLPAEAEETPRKTWLGRLVTRALRSE